jgi:hypothetical protein
MVEFSAKRVLLEKALFAMEEWRDSALLKNNHLWTHPVPWILKKTPYI